MMKNLIRHIFSKFGFEIWRISEMKLLNILVARIMHEHFFFIQIGANNGRRGDPVFRLVRRYNLRGLAVEPVKEYFEELCLNYRGDACHTREKRHFF